MNDEEKNKILEEANKIAESSRRKIEGCDALADLVKNQYNAFIAKGFDKQQATYFSSKFISMMIKEIMNRN